MTTQAMGRVSLLESSKQQKAGLHGSFLINNILEERPKLKVPYVIRFFSMFHHVSHQLLQCHISLDSRVCCIGCCFLSKIDCEPQTLRFPYLCCASSYKLSCCRYSHNFQPIPRIIDYTRPFQCFSIGYIKGMSMSKLPSHYFPISTNLRAVLNAEQPIRL